MFHSNHILVRCLNQKIVWCVIALVAAGLYLLFSRSYSAFAVLTVVVLISIFAVIDQFVFSQITPERIIDIPEIRSD